MMSRTGLDDSLSKLPDENFPVALPFLPDSLRHDLKAVYAFARLVDDIGDTPRPVGQPPGQVLAELDAVREDLDRVFAAMRPRNPVLGPLCPAIHRRGLPRAPFEALIEANRLDQTVTDYRDRAQLLRYCRLSANPVGHLVLGVFEVSVTPGRRTASDAVCTALQIIEHLQDISEDAARGRIYLPESDRRRHGVLPSDLRAPRASPGLCRLVLAEADWAEDLLTRGSDLVGMTCGWPRLAVAGYVAGGRTALGDLRRRRGDPLSRPTIRRRRELVYHAARILMGGRLR
jgi:squalene synthase HpnC